MATPYEVSLIFPVQLGLDERIEWKFARDLLAVGVNAQTGIGDVTVEPAEKLELVEITLRGKDDEEEEDGETALWLPRPQVTDFLRQTYERVPSGHESSYALTQLNKCVEKLDFLIWKQTYPKLRTPK